MTAERNALDLAEKYKSWGIFVDTELFVLLVYGAFDKKNIPLFGKLDSFSERDFDWLFTYVSLFRTIVATPQILTEVSNHLPETRNFKGKECHRILGEKIKLLNEKNPKSIDIIKLEAYYLFGLSDTSLIDSVSDEFLTITTDKQLYFYLLSRGWDAINYRHIQQVIL